MTKNIINNLIISVIIFALLLTMLPPQQTQASTKKKYLVLVGQSDGTFAAYDDLVVDIKGYPMVKAKPLASALNVKYSVRTGSTKGCILESQYVKNTYTRNSKKFISEIGTYTGEYEAPYKQCFVDSYNLIYYDTVKAFMNINFFKASKAPEYYKLGYTGGVIVYNPYQIRPTLPNFSAITMWNGQVYVKNLATREVTLSPILRDYTFDGEPTNKYINVLFFDFIKSEKILIDYQPIQDVYKKHQLPREGIYALGHCNDPLIIQGLDAQGNVLKEYTTTDDVFLIDLPGASELCIINTTNKYSLTRLDFTPVKPTIITDTMKIPFSNISWLTASDGLARQYFVLAECVETNIENLTTWQAVNTCYIETDKTNNNTTKNSYSLVTVMFEKNYYNLTSNDIYLNFTKRVTLPLIDNPNVMVYDTNKDLWATNYENELTKMLSAVKQIGSNSYFPTQNFSRQVIIRSQSVDRSNAGDEQIVLTPENFNLDCARDYLTHLHEIAHYFETTNTDYGWMVSAWAEGIAEVLSRQALASMNIAQDSSVHQFGKITLTPEQASDFECYYLTLDSSYSGETAYNLGYHFIIYLQKTYGNDIVYKIYKAEMEANISQQINGYYCRDNERDKLFTGCIKSLTSQNVFQDFVEYYQRLN